MKHHKKDQPPRSKRPRLQGKEDGAKKASPSAENLTALETRSTKDEVSSEVAKVTLPVDLSAGSVPDRAEDILPPNSSADSSAPTGPLGAAERRAGKNEVGADTLATEGFVLSAGAAQDSPLAPKIAPDMTALAPLPFSDILAKTSTDVPRLSKRTGAEEIVRDYQTLAMGAGLIPVPGLDLAAIGGLQLRLLASLAARYEVAFTRAQAQLIVTSLLGTVGTTVLAGGVLMSFAKAIPVFGALLGAASLPLAGGAITHAIGHLAIDHFEAGGTMKNFDLDVAQRAFVHKVAAAKAALA